MPLNKGQNYGVRINCGFRICLSPEPHTKTIRPSYIVKAKRRSIELFLGHCFNWTACSIFHDSTKPRNTFTRERPLGGLLTTLLPTYNKQHKCRQQNRAHSPNKVVQSRTICIIHIASVFVLCHMHQCVSNRYS